MLFLIVSFTVATLLTWYFLFRVVGVYLRSKMTTLPPGWREVTRLARESRAPVPSQFRSPALRRLLLLCSSKPSLFTNKNSLTTESVDVAKLEAPDQNKRLIGFFHPNSDAGGGGERVVWAAIKQTLQTESNIVVLYTAEKPGLTHARLVELASERFALRFSSSEANRIVVIFLTKALYFESSTYPLLTLAGQALGAALLSYEAISNLMPDLFVDTVGAAFGYPIVSWLTNAPIVAYVHYPFVQSDMLKTLRWFSPKQIYWRGLLQVYRFCGLFATQVAANSSWTANHLSSTWKNSNIKVVFPPCAVQELNFDSEKERSPSIVYVAQFREEKRHELVLKAFAKVKQSKTRINGQRPHLLLIGSVRGVQDEQRVVKLQELAHSLGLTNADFTIVTNAPWEAVKGMLESSSIGLNAMWNEHFGMGVVEVMAAGLVPVVHASAGPLMDILRDSEGVPGFFFQSKSDPDFTQRTFPALSDALVEACSLTRKETQKLRVRAHLAAQRFSDEAFYSAWQQLVHAAMAK